VCSYKALILYGKPMTAGEIFDAVKRDKMFYDSSGGGVTVSGGEALLQPQLIAELFEKCHKAGIHTCIETSGFAPESSLKQVLPYCDYILCDLKLMDPEKHRQYTGKPNTLVLSNARVIAGSGKEFLFRMPLIPGINDDSQNIKGTAEFLRSLGKKALRIELMPYHRLGKGKYESLDKKYLLPDLRASEPEHLESVKKEFEDNGISCTVSK
jgi:pyruvate formate lyase activating enzyme